MLIAADFVRIGSVKKAFGYNGAMMLSLEKKVAYHFLNKKEAVFLQLEGSLVPFFIDDIKGNEINPVIHFDNIHNKETASRFIGVPCFMPGEYFEQNQGVSDPDTLEGFTLFDKTSGMTGIILDYSEQNNNPLFEVDFDGMIVSLPAHPDMITDFDSEEKIIYAEYPEGLISESR
ncbi:MAG: hypothetical protein ACLFM1_01420 [Bacteroidales bacterium]